MELFFIYFNVNYEEESVIEYHLRFLRFFSSTTRERHSETYIYIRCIYLNIECLSHVIVHFLRCCCHYLLITYTYMQVKDLYRMYYIIMDWFISINLLIYFDETTIVLWLLLFLFFFFLMSLLFPSGSIIIQNQMSFPSVDDKRKWSDHSLSLFRLFSQMAMSSSFLVVSSFFFFLKIDRHSILC